MMSPNALVCQRMRSCFLHVQQTNVKKRITLASGFKKERTDSDRWPPLWRYLEGVLYKFSLIDFLLMLGQYVL